MESPATRELAGAGAGAGGSSAEVVKLFSFPNGALSKHRLLAPPSGGDAAAEDVYRECMRNHAASLGGHALDGCGEFMPSPASDPAVPASLTCAACGCHRNFHRRIPMSSRFLRPLVDDDGEDHDRDVAPLQPKVQLAEGEDGEGEGEPRQSPAHASAPHMLLALSQGPLACPASASMPLPKKRFRTRFSPDQKERMQELSKRLGWRMQRRDDAVVDQWCREIGITRGVFKVWMHNNKHNYHERTSSRCMEMNLGVNGGGGREAIAGGGVAAIRVLGLNGGVAGSGSGPTGCYGGEGHGCSKDSGCVLNGSSPSS